MLTVNSDIKDTYVVTSKKLLCVWCGMVTLEPQHDNMKR